MPRVHRINKARKPQGNCPRCGTAITVGMPYLKWAFRYGGTHKRCVNCPPKPSELTQSEILGAAYGISEQYDPHSCESIEDLREMQQEVVDEIEQIVDLIQEKLDNIESGCGHTDLPVYEELESRREMYEEWKQEVEDVDIEDVECPDCGGSGKDDDAICEECDGSGEIECEKCSNDREPDAVCPSCEDTGTVDCEECNASGRVERDCSTCSGDGTGVLDEDADCIGELAEAISNCPE